MKWRVILAVAFVLTIFAGFAYLYVNTFVRKHQHAVILFVVNGLDLDTLNRARQELGRGPSPLEPDDPLISDARRSVAYRSDTLSLDSFWNFAFLTVQGPGRPVPDEGADATALACGAQVDNGYVAVSARNEPLRSLMYAAEQAQRATGLVTTASLVEPTPVAFYSTTKGTPEPYRNAEDLIYSDISVVLGGGADYFTPASVSDEMGRRDGRNLLNEAAARGYALVRTRDELDRLSLWGTRQILGVFAPQDFYFSSLQPKRTTQPSLAEMTRLAITNLNHSLNGYFLVVAPALVARASERNLGHLAANEVGAVDEAIASAVEYAGPDALVVVTNSYNLGAMGPLALAPPLAPAIPPPAPVPPAPKKATSRHLVAAAPAVTNLPPPAPVGPAAWVVGPGGPPSTHEDMAWLQQRYDEGSFVSDATGRRAPQAALRFQPQALPTGAPAWLASRGDGSLELRGVFNNTDLYELLVGQF